MASYRLVVLSNPTPGREDEYNDWYNNQHLGEVLLVPGITTARRFKLRTDTLAPEVKPAHNYLAIYEIEANNLNDVLVDLRSRPGTPAMYISDAFDRTTVSMLAYEAITPLVRSKL